MILIQLTRMPEHWKYRTKLPHSVAPAVLYILLREGNKKITDPASPLVPETHETPDPTVLLK
jgi:hypothetical protein